MGTIVFGSRLCLDLDWVRSLPRQLILDFLFPGGNDEPRCLNHTRRRSLERPLHGGNELDLLDSIQLVNHTEHFAHTPLHELILLRQAECQPLDARLPGVMCGRSPYLTPCTPDDAALQRMAEACTGGAARSPLRGLKLPYAECRSSDGCFSSQQTLWCPRTTSSNDQKLEHRAVLGPSGVHSGSASVQTARPSYPKLEV